MKRFINPFVPKLYIDIHHFVERSMIYDIYDIWDWIGTNGFIEIVTNMRFSCLKDARKTCEKKYNEEKRRKTNMNDMRN